MVSRIYVRKITKHFERYIHYKLRTVPYVLRVHSLLFIDFSSSSLTFSLSQKEVAKGSAYYHHHAIPVLLKQTFVHCKPNNRNVSNCFLDCVCPKHYYLWMSSLQWIWILSIKTATLKLNRTITIARIILGFNASMIGIPIYRIPKALSILCYQCHQQSRLCRLLAQLQFLRVRWCWSR